MRSKEQVEGRLCTAGGPSSFGMREQLEAERTQYPRQTPWRGKCAGFLSREITALIKKEPGLLRNDALAGEVVSREVVRS